MIPTLGQNRVFIQRRKRPVKNSGSAGTRDRKATARVPTFPNPTPASTMTTRRLPRPFLVEAGVDERLGGDPCGRLPASLFASIWRDQLSYRGVGPLRSPFLYIKLWRMVMPCGALPPERLLLEDDLIRFDDRRCGNEGGDFGHLRLQVGTTRPASPRVGFGLPQRDICTKRETR